MTAIETVALLLFAFGAAAVLYLMFGYPLLLRLLRWPQAPPVAKDASYQPFVTMLIAVHNGDAYLRKKLDVLLAQDYPRDKFEIVVSSDGSTDRTHEIAREFADRGVVLVENSRAGKATALAAGIARARGEVIFFNDVRQWTHPAALKSLVANLADPTVGGVTGEMGYSDDPDSGAQATLDIFWQYELWVRRKHAAIHSCYGATGAIWAARRTLIAPLEPDTLSDDVTMPIRIYLRGYRVVTEAAAIALDVRVSHGAEFARKVRTLAGLWQVFQRHPQLFGANPMRMHFLAHKFGRLVLPWFLLLTYLSSVFLTPGLARDVIWAGEAALLLMGLLGAILPHGFPMRKLFAAAATFLTMNYTAAVSIGVLWGSATRYWTAPTKSSTPPK